MRDTFRKDYDKSNEATLGKVFALKKKADELEALMLEIQSREMSLAITNLEQAVMWATKAFFGEKK